MDGTPCHRAAVCGLGKKASPATIAASAWLLLCAGVGTLLEILDEYYDARQSLGPLLELPVHRCLVLAADCLTAVLNLSNLQVALPTLLL